MRRVLIGVCVLGALVAASQAAAGTWTAPRGLVNAVVSPPVQGGGYADPPGSNAPVAGQCGPIALNSNHSESWLAVQPGTENLVGASKFFVDRYSTFYNFYLGSYSLPGGQLAGANQVQGYDCVSTGTQAMPPSWTNNTDPNVAFDTQGRAYQVTLPFNAYWANMHPNGAIGISYSDDLGRHWTNGNGGAYLEQAPNQTSLALGHVEDKQWVAVNNYASSRYHDHVYAMWTVFNGSNGNGKLRVAISRDRGQSFTKAVDLQTPNYTTPATTYVYPSVGPDGTVYVAFVGGYDTKNKNRSGAVYVTKSTDDGVTWGPFVQAATPVEDPTGTFANTNFRDGIIESFAPSQTYPGHAYLTYENWNVSSGTSDVYFTQTTDGGNTWSAPTQVNDDAGTASSDQFQPSIAAGPGDAVAVAFYDRRANCGTGADVLAAHRGAANTCVDVTVQAYRDTGSGAVAVGANVRASQSSWDPDQPGQKVGGLSQYPCAGHTDPCPAGRGFIGDYFGLAISGANIYALNVSTHYPSSVAADDGTAVYYQQQVLATIPRSSLGL